MRNTILLTSFALVCSAAPALAQGKPVIEAVKFSTGKEVKMVPQGGIIYLEGRDLFEPKPVEKDPRTGRPKPVKDRYAGLSVTIDGNKCNILESTLTRVTVQVPPNAKTGRSRTITLKVAGRGSATKKIDVVSMKEWQDSESNTEKTSETGSGVSEAVERKILGAFQIKSFLIKPGGAGATFEVKGLARNIPDGLRVQLTLIFDKRNIRSRAVPIKKGEFVATFGPYKEKLLVGNYACEMLFAINKQSRVKAMRWLKTLKKDEKDQYKRIIRRGYVSYGGTGANGAITVEDRAEQQKELQDHCKELAGSCEKLLNKLAYAYGGAARSFYKKASASGYDEAAYLAWLEKVGIAADAAEAEKINKDTTYGSRAGHFQDTAWEAFAKDELIPGLQEAYNLHTKFNSRFIAPPDGRAERLGEFLISNVAKLFTKWTMHLYGKSKLQIPQEIRSMPFNTISAPRASLKYFAAKKRELMKVVGVE